MRLNDVRVSLTVAAEEDSVVLRYVVENGAEHPVMILDRMRDWSKPQSWTSSVLPLQEDWAYVELVGSTAIIKRQMLRDDGWSEEKESPCGRQLDPGGRLEGRLRLSLPLQERSIRGTRSLELEATDIDQAEFRLGWIPKPTFDPGVYAPERVGEELIWPFGYGFLATRQQVSASQRLPVDWAGLAFER